MLTSTAKMVLTWAVAMAMSTAAMTPEMADDACEMICERMPDMVGCGLRTTCKEAAAHGASSKYCNSFALLKELCIQDMNVQPGNTNSPCHSYLVNCNASLPTPLPAECEMTTLPEVPTTREANDKIGSICSGMMGGMDGCSDSGNSILRLSKLCTAMSSMSECNEFNSMCSAVRNEKDDALRDLCYSKHSGGMGGMMMMAMYFHTGIKDTLLIKSLTPSSYSQYIACCILSILLGALAHFLGVARVILEKTISRRLLALPLNDSSPLMRSSGKGSSWQRFHFVHDLARALVGMAHLGVGYMAMLVAMTYNVGYFVCVIVGYGISTFIFHRFTLRPPGSSSKEEFNPTMSLSCCE